MLTPWQAQQSNDFSVQSWAMIFGRMWEKANLPFVSHCAECKAGSQLS